MKNDNEKIRHRYDRIAKFFDAFEYMMEKGKIGLWRDMLWRQAEGKVLEIGVGTGKNIKYYSDNISVTAVDFSEKMLEKARDKTVKEGKIADLRLMDVQKLEFPDEAFDTVTATFVFCSVPDAIKGLREIKRVCRKDGKVILLEHVRSRNRFIGLLMDIFNPLVVRIVGANINRNTSDNIKKAGLIIKLEKDLMFDMVKYFECRKPSS